MKKLFCLFAFLSSSHCFAQSDDTLAIELNLDTIYVSEPLHNNGVNTFSIRLSDQEASSVVIARDLILIKLRGTEAGDLYQLIPQSGATTATLFVMFNKGKSTFKGPVYIFRVE